MVNLYSTKKHLTMGKSTHFIGANARKEMFYAG